MRTRMELLMNAMHVYQTATDERIITRADMLAHASSTLDAAESKWQRPYTQSDRMRIAELFIAIAPILDSASGAELDDRPIVFPLRRITSEQLEELDHRRMLYGRMMNQCYAMSNAYVVAREQYARLAELEAYLYRRMWRELFGLDTTWIDWN